MATIGRRAYAEMFGPTVGDRLRLADTDLIVEVEADYTLRAGSSALSRSADADFSTQGRVVHVVESKSEGEKLVGVQFTGPRFQRVFRSESAA